MKIFTHTWEAVSAVLRSRPYVGLYIVLNGRGRGDACDKNAGACLRTDQPRTLTDDRKNAALERRGIRMIEPTEHHRDEQGVSDPILSPFSNAYIAECNQAKIAFLRIAGGKGLETTMALPHLLNPTVPE